MKIVLISATGMSCQVLKTVYDCKIVELLWFRVRVCGIIVKQFLKNLVHGHFITCSYSTKLIYNHNGQSYVQPLKCKCDMYTKFIFDTRITDIKILTVLIKFSLQDYKCMSLIVVGAMSSKENGQKMSKHYIKYYIKLKSLRRP